MHGWLYFPMSKEGFGFIRSPLLYRYAAWRRTYHSASDSPETNASNVDTSE